LGKLTEGARRGTLRYVKELYLLRPDSILFRVAQDLAEAVGERFSSSYSESTLAKIARNTFSSWEQTGHLVEAREVAPVWRPTVGKVSRSRARPKP
jgi:hypothetical protein